MPPEWNFYKYIISPTGTLVQVFSPENDVLEAATWIEEEFFNKKSEL
jgi:glutathione peroxidase-family protein